MVGSETDKAGGRQSESAGEGEREESRRRAGAERGERARGRFASHREAHGTCRVPAVDTRRASGTAAVAGEGAENSEHNKHAAKKAQRTKPAAPEPPTALSDFGARVAAEVVKQLAAVLALKAETPAEPGREGAHLNPVPTHTPCAVA